MSMLLFQRSSNECHHLSVSLLWGARPGRSVLHMQWLPFTATNPRLMETEWAGRGIWAWVGIRVSRVRRSRIRVSGGQEVRGPSSWNGSGSWNASNAGGGGLGCKHYAAEIYRALWGVWLLLYLFTCLYLLVHNILPISYFLLINSMYFMLLCVNDLNSIT